MKAAAYRYVNAQCNDGVECENLLYSEWHDSWSGQDGWRTDAQTGEIGPLAPGQRYWIKLTNRTGDTHWYDYTVPVHSAEEADFSMQLSKAAFCYGERIGSNITATSEKIEKRCDSSPLYNEKSGYVYLKYYLTFKTFKDPTSYYMFITLILPNGDPYVVTSSFDTFCGRESRTWYFWYGPYWDDIYKKYGEIPAGEYTLVIGLGKHEDKTAEYIVGTKTLEVGK